MAQLSVEIVGETKKLEKALKDSERSLKNFESKAKALNNKINKSTVLQGKLAIATEKVEREFAKGVITQSKYENSIRAISKADQKLSNSTKNLRSNLTKTNKSIKDLGGTKGFKKLEKGAVSGTSAMTAFSRTVQDAPFGIMGVSNNITNLTEQFGYLKNKTGSAGGALKAMLRDLKGFGGIGLGISVATSLLLVFGDKISFVSEKTKTLKKLNEGVASSLGSSYSKFKILTDILVDTNSSYSDQQKAIKILNKEYSDFDTSQITSEDNFKSGKIAIDNYTKSLIAQAKATAGLDIIAEKQAKILELEEKRLPKLESVGARNDKQLEERRKKAIARELKNSKASTAAQIKEVKDRVNKKYDIIKNSYQDEIKLLQKSIDDISRLADIKAGLLAGGGLSGDTSTDNSNDPRQKVSTLFNELNAIATKGVQDFGITFQGLEIFPIRDFDVQAEILKAKMLQFNEQVRSQIEGSIAGTFGRLGEVIGSGMGNAAQVFSQGIGALLGIIGDSLIKLGTAAVLAGTVTKLFGAISGIGAGLAAIAGGVALKAVSSGISSSLGSFGGVGNSSGGSTNGGADRYSPRSSNSGSFSSSGGGLQNVVFEIQGTKLVGVLSNTLARNRSLGGSLGIG